MLQYHNVAEHSMTVHSLAGLFADTTLTAQTAWGDPVPLLPPPSPKAPPSPLGISSPSHCACTPGNTSCRTGDQSWGGGCGLAGFKGCPASPPSLPPPTPLLPPIGHLVWTRPRLSGHDLSFCYLTLISIFHVLAHF